MKRILSIVISIFLILGCLAGCGSGSGQPQPGEEDSKFKIVTTIFPIYDWVVNVLGDDPAGTEVTMLLNSGVDLHSFQPTAADIMKISTCDMFIYVGGESDEWVEDALKEATNKDMIVINLMDLMGDAAKEEEMVEGMQEERGDDEEGSEYDEHVWLSLRNASLLTNAISTAIQEMDPANADQYQANTAAFVEKLEALDEEYKAAVSGAQFNTLLFGDRFPFRYLADDYGLSYYAAFVGCSSETEASFATVTFLAQKMDELALPAVMTIEGIDQRIAETIIQSTESKDQEILTLDSMQAVTAKDVENGATYLSIMENNLSVLKDALKSEA